MSANYNVSAGQWFAQQFSTGGNTYGYLLDSIGLDMNGGDGNEFGVSVYADSNGVPGTLLHGLSGASNPGLGVNDYTAPALWLAPSRSYWVVASDINISGYFWNFTADGYTSADGWSLGSSAVSTTFGSSWSTGVGNIAQLSITGRPVTNSAFAQTGRYYQNFTSFSAGATNFNDGSELFSTALGATGGAELADSFYGELGLTESGHSSVISAFELPDLNPGTPVYAFSAKWNSQVYGDFLTNAADGFSLNFGQLSSLNLTNYPNESGYGVGLSFDVQTYSGNHPGFYLRANGNVLASHPYTPSAQWGEYNATRHLFEVDWNAYTGMNVSVDGVAIFTNVPTPGFVPHAGDRFVWGARCGLYTEQVRLANIAVVTGGNLVPAGTTSPYFGDSGTFNTRPASAAFDNNLSTFWLSNESGFTGWYLGASLTSPRPVPAYLLTSGPLQGRPHAWTVDGSSDGGGSWIGTSSQSVNFLNFNETRAFLQPSDTPSFDACRLYITSDSYAGTEITVDELKFYNFISAPPPPPLTASVSGNNLIISWPSNQFNWIAQENTDLATANWVSVTNPVSYANGQYQITLPHSNAKAFFRMTTP